MQAVACIVYEVVRLLNMFINVGAKEHADDAE